jgi:hypothetical protein
MVLWNLLVLLLPLLFGLAGYLDRLVGDLYVEVLLPDTRYLRGHSVTLTVVHEVEWRLSHRGQSRPSWLHEHPLPLGPELVE